VRQALYKNRWCDVIKIIGYQVTIDYISRTKTVEISKIDTFRDM
jgi:hypothetical protein